MSSKNTLQELCISEGMAPPSYSTKKIGGPAHEPQWISMVTTTLQNNQSVTVPGQICSSKIEAEKSAATEALQSLVISKDELSDGIEKIVVESVNVTPDTVTSGKIYILIDAENLPNMIFSAVILARKRKDVTVFAFIGQHHHSAEKNYGKHVTKIIVPTTRKDGVDTYIQMFVGKTLSNTSDIVGAYAIVTRDHFGHALAELIWTPSPGTSLAWKPAKAAVITTEEQLNAFVK